MNVYGIELLKRMHHEKEIFCPINLLEFTDNILDTGPHFKNLV